MKKLPPTSYPLPSKRPCTLNLEKGFTLIEIFLTTALLSLVFFTIFSAYSSGIRIWKSVKGVGFVEDRKFYLSIEKIRRELSAYIRDFDEIEFEGDKESITFPYVSDQKIVEVTYLFDKKQDILVRESTKFSESLKDKMNKEVKTLFKADNVSFSYLFPDKTKEAGAANWVTSFSNENKGTPKAIKIKGKRQKKDFSFIVFIPE